EPRGEGSRIGERAGGRATLRATAVPALMSGLDYNILGGMACTDAALRVTHPPRARRATARARVKMLGAAHWGSRARRVGDSVLATGPVPPPGESSKYRCPGGRVAPGAPPWA